MPIPFDFCDYKAGADTAGRALSPPFTLFPFLFALTLVN
jgi:hypothetical protein